MYYSLYCRSFAVLVLLLFILFSDWRNAEVFRLLGVVSLLFFLYGIYFKAFLYRTLCEGISCMHAICALI